MNNVRPHSAEKTDVFAAERSADCSSNFLLPIAQISTCVTDSSSPGYNNTAGQKNKVMEKSCLLTQSDV